MAQRLKEPKDFNATLISRVRQGVAYVINWKEFAKLPTTLKTWYYPLFRRMDTTYRLKQQYMRARRDIDPGTVSPTIVTPRRVMIPRQRTMEPVKEFQPAGALVESNGRGTKTPLSKRTMSDIVMETRESLRTRPTINTRFSRF